MENIKSNPKKEKSDNLTVYDSIKTIKNLLNQILKEIIQTNFDQNVKTDLIKEVYSLIHYSFTSNTKNQDFLSINNLEESIYTLQNILYTRKLPETLYFKIKGNLNKAINEIQNIIKKNF